MGGVAAAGSAQLAEGSRVRGEIGSALAAVRVRLGLVALAGVAWWWSAVRMAGMDAGPGSDLGTLAWFVGVWVVMMAAMMFPSVSPTVALYARMTRRRGVARPLLFTGAYLVVWSAAGVVAYGAFLIGRRWFGSTLTWDSGGRWFAGGVLVIAALYELTPLKNVCLAKCRSPLGFLLGCCWALMAALFALGMMSLAWTALIAAFITVEKTLPWGRVAMWITAAVLLALGIVLMAAPQAVPGLVVPGAMHGMSM